MRMIGTPRPNPAMIEEGLFDPLPRRPDGRKACIFLISTSSESVSEPLHALSSSVWSGPMDSRRTDGRTPTQGACGRLSLCRRSAFRTRPNFFPDIDDKPMQLKKIAILTLAAFGLAATCTQPLAKTARTRSGARCPRRAPSLRGPRALGRRRPRLRPYGRAGRDRGARHQDRRRDGHVHGLHGWRRLCGGLFGRRNPRHRARRRLGSHDGARADREELPWRLKVDDYKNLAVSGIEFGKDGRVKLPDSVIPSEELDPLPQ